MDAAPEFVQEIPDLLRLAVTKMNDGDTTTATWILMNVAQRLKEPADCPVERAINSS